MGEWLTEAAPGLAVILLLMLRAQAVPDPVAAQEEGPRWLDLLGTLWPVGLVVAALLWGAIELRVRAMLAARDAQLWTDLRRELAGKTSMLDLQTVLGAFGKERDRYVEEVSHAGREAANAAMLNAGATLRERIDRVEGEVSGCRTDMDAARDRANEAASAVAQLQTKVAEMDRRISESITGTRDVLLAELRTIQAKMDRGSARSRKEDP